MHSRAPARAHKKARRVLEMNALSHGFASAIVAVADARDLHHPISAGAEAYECVNAVDLARSNVPSRNRDFGSAAAVRGLV